MAVVFNGIVLRNRRDVLKSAQEELFKKGVVASIRELSLIAKRGQMTQAGRLEASCSRQKMRHRGKARVVFNCY